MARRTLPLLLVLTVLLCSACGTTTQVHDELTFDLPKDFIDLSREGYADTYDFLYSDGIIALAGIRETRQALSAYYGQLDAQQYTRLVIKLNGIACEPEQRDGLWCFTYEAVSGGTPMTYVCAVYEADTCFWQVQAYCSSSDFAAQQETMWKLITSMTAG